MGTRFEIAIGTIPKEPIQEQEHKPAEKDIQEKKIPAKNLEDLLNLPFMMEVPNFLNESLPVGPTGIRGDTGIQGFANRSQSLRITGPNGNQIIIPLRNIIARAQPADGYTGSSGYELVINQQADAIMADIRAAQRANGIPIPQQGT